MIELKNISKTYHIGEVAVPALRGVSLKISPGEFVAIMGPSGSGKSTLLHILGLLDRPDNGSYHLIGKDVSTLSQEELATFRNEFIGFVFQLFNLLPRLKARENVSLPLVYTSDLKSRKFSSPEDLLRTVGLGDRINHNPNELSGGEQQRVAIARALIKNPKIILADEPTGNLDSSSAQELLKILKSLNDSGITIVMVTHEKELTRGAKRIIKLLDGKIVSDEYLTGKPHTISEERGEARAPERGEGGVPPDLKIHRFDFFRLKNYFSQAMGSLLSNKYRSFLSILGILIGVAAVIAMLALGTGAREDIKKRLASLGSNLLSVRPPRHRVGGIHLEPGSITRLTIEDAEEIKKIPYVRRVNSTVSGRGQVVYGNKNWNTRIRGVTPEYAFIRASQAAEGRFFNDVEMITRSKVALLGKTVVRELFEDENAIGEYVKINRINFRVIGILPEKGATGWRDRDDEIILPLNTAMYRLLGKKYIDYIDVEVEDEKEMEKVQEEVRKLIIQRHNIPSDREDTIEVRNMAEIQEAISSTARTFAWLLGSIAFISLLVGGIGIMNIMLVSVTERTREIGLRKAIGANNKDILSQFIIEAIVICLVGGILGILFGAAISGGLSKFAGWSTKVSLGAVLLAFLFSGGIGLFFGLLPARKASLLNPIDALRYE
ncbi:ATP-binding cassette domain-containing protein [bacterium]|nr:ATP-binding cassette domain-containing protein [bacterium]NIN93182.1 ATP-binding cassette domain-containing protein [bacterium]NIO18979.1 ATP-binding cassette domain-containing protein [bacterium]NIO74108.1 ATP-binding cassette domain-containing protein [bacterium]